MIWYPPQVEGIRFYPPQGDTMEEWRGANEDWRKLMNDPKSMMDIAIDMVSDQLATLTAENAALREERDEARTLLVTCSAFLKLLDRKEPHESVTEFLEKIHAYTNPKVQ